jgi:hypothetical protein
MYGPSSRKIKSDSAMIRAFPTTIEWLTRYTPCARSGLLFNQLSSQFLRFGLLALRSRFISEALALDAQDGAVSAVNVIVSSLYPVRVTEIEFCEVAVQMLFAAMLINAFHAAFENAVMAFHRVRTNKARTYSSALWLTLSSYR